MIEFVVLSLVMAATSSTLVVTNADMKEAYSTQVATCYETSYSVMQAGIADALRELKNDHQAYVEVPPQEGEGECAKPSFQYHQYSDWVDLGGGNYRVTCEPIRFGRLRLSIEAQGAERIITVIAAKNNVTNEWVECNTPFTHALYTPPELGDDAWKWGPEQLAQVDEIINAYMPCLQAEQSPLPYLTMTSILCNPECHNIFLNSLCPGGEYTISTFRAENIFNTVRNEIVPQLFSEEQIANSPEVCSDEEVIGITHSLICRYIPEPWLNGDVQELSQVDQLMCSSTFSCAPLMEEAASAARYEHVVRCVQQAACHPQIQCYQPPRNYAICQYNQYNDNSCQFRFNPDDDINGNVYCRGSVWIPEGCRPKGDVCAAGQIVYGEEKAEPTQRLPQCHISFPDYERERDVIYVNPEDFTEPCQYIVDGNECNAFRHKDPNHPASIFIMNPSNCGKDIDATSCNDFFFEDMFSCDQQFGYIGDRGQDEEPKHDADAGCSINLSPDGNNKIYLIDGNIWCHSTRPLTYMFKSQGDGTQCTMVAKGNIFISDNVCYENMETDAVAFIAIKADGEDYIDDAQRALTEGSGNIRFGDPAFETFQFCGNLYAENNFYCDNVNSNLMIYGNMTAGNQIRVSDPSAERKALVLDYDARLENGSVSLPGIPTTPKEEETPVNSIAAYSQGTFCVKGFAEMGDCCKVVE